ncbi:MAG: polymer-forming cytoskeletal protein [Candidatus Omnitrophica bacterium]|nr:polymer-forming cytoskeletal protein [Candidatus Omnitrophota bacterium]
MLKKKVEEKILDVNASMKGSLVFSDPVHLRINGKFEGNLKTKGTLEIGRNAEVKAEIEGEVVNIAGKVKGKILADKKMVLLSTAVVEGDLVSPLLQIEEGAIFEGNCRMIQEKMDIREVSRYLDIEEDKILEWASSGRIPALKEGDRWLFERRRIEDWIKETAK